MTFIDVEVGSPGPQDGSGDVPHDDGPDGARRPRRRAVLVGVLVVGATAVALAVALGVRAAHVEPDLDAAEAAVVEVANGIGAAGGSDAMIASSVTAGPDRSVSGSSGTVPAAGTLDFTVVCTSIDGRDAHLVVQVAGVAAATVVVACADASDPGTAPAVTVVPTLEAPGRWAFELTGETRAAVALVIS
ncbi:MAG TPA: hypothetical protein VGC57_05945 [Cellulomonas sp.]